MTQRYVPVWNVNVSWEVSRAIHLWVDLWDLDWMVETQSIRVRDVVDEHYNPVRGSFMAMIS